MWRTPADVPGHSVDLGEAGDTENLSEVISLWCRQITRENVPPSLITGFESALRAAAFSSSTASSYGALRPGTHFM
jgi:hypothetical protein